MNGELVVTDDVPGAFAAEVVSAFVNRPNEEFDIALSGGETARACYERLAAQGAHAIDWLAVNVFWGDERCVPPDTLTRTSCSVVRPCSNASAPPMPSTRCAATKAPMPTSSAWAK